MLVLIIWFVMKNNIHAVLFDLDGTLLDTAPDLYTAMLDTLAHFGHESISFKNFRPQVHAGTKSMVLASFSIDEMHPDYAAIRETFLKHYQQQLTEKTQFFSGIPKVLDHLDKQEMPWGIVTNKPGWLTEPLLKHFKINKRSRCIVSGDTLTNKTALQLYYDLAGLQWKGEGYGLSYYPKVRQTEQCGAFMEEYNEPNCSNIDMPTEILNRLDTINRYEEIVTDDVFTAHASIALRKQCILVANLSYQMEFFGKGSLKRVPK